MLIKYNSKTLEVCVYFKLIVLKQLRKTKRKVPAIKQKQGRDIDTYRAYQKNYQQKYYHTNVKPVREQKNERKVK